MENLYRLIPLAYFVASTILLMVLAFLLLASAMWDLATSAVTEDRVDQALNGVGLLIIGFAVMETAKFIAEEEILRQRELRSPRESRHSITKFISIIVIAASLEALVMVFKTGLANIPDAIYPAGLLIAAMLALVGLGTYQFLSSRIGAPPGIDEQAAD